MIVLTELEAWVAARIRRGVDPQIRAGSGTRRVSQTLGRLRRKGAIIDVASGINVTGYALTPEGEAALEQRWGAGGKHVRDQAKC